MLQLMQSRDLNASLRQDIRGSLSILQGYFGGDAAVAGDLPRSGNQPDFYCLPQQHSLSPNSCGLGMKSEHRDRCHTRSPPPQFSSKRLSCSLSLPR